MEFTLRNKHLKEVLLIINSKNRKNMNKIVLVNVKREKKLTHLDELFKEKESQFNCSSDA